MSDSASPILGKGGRDALLIVIHEPVQFGSMDVITRKGM